MDYSLLKSLPPHEIPMIFERATLFGGRIAQATLNHQINSVITKIEIDSDGKLIINLLEEIHVEHEHPLSVSLNYRNLLFRLDPKKYSIRGKVIMAEIPKIAKALTIRENERYALPINSDIDLFLSRIEKRGAPGELKASIIDFSKTGFGLIIHNTEVDSLLKNDHLWIKNINGNVLTRPVFANVVYTKNRKYKDDVLDTRLGVSLQNSIPEEVFLELQEKCLLILDS